MLLNVALHGMEQAAGVRYHPASHRDAGTAVPVSPVLIRYADDLLALCHSREQAEQVKARLAVWLEPRGLTFNEDKTRVVGLDEGCDFLGFTVRRYDGKLLIKPSKAALVRLRKRLSAEMRALRGLNAEAVLTRLNPIIRGWSAYYRHVVSSKEFNSLDDHMWKLDLQVGQAHPSAQAEAMDHLPLLRCIPSRQRGQVGVRRPGHRRLPAEVLLDADRPACLVVQGLGRRRTTRPWPNTGPRGAAAQLLRHWVAMR